MSIGTVISGVSSPSPSKILFVLNGNGSVHKGQFVELDYEEGRLAAMVTDVVKTNRYFERADSVKEIESKIGAMEKHFPVAEWEYAVAEAKTLGVIAKDGIIRRPTFAVSPGTKVRVASKETLQKFLGFVEGGLFLGRVEFHDVDVKLDINRLLQKHLAILAMSGAGKTVTAKTLIEELLERKKEQGRIAVIVLDVHGEYTSFAHPPKDESARDYSQKTKLINALEMKIGVSKISARMFSEMLPGLSNAQKRDLEKVINKLQKEMREGSGPFDLKMVKNEVLNDKDIKEATKRILASWLSGLEELNLFAKVDYPNLYDVIKPGMLTVLDMSGIINMKKKQIIVNYLAQRLFAERRKKLLPPFLLILEEAHQFVPEHKSREESICKGIIQTIAREGRKFGAALCLISQRPIRLDTTVLSQCNTQIIMRITNPYDLKHIGESAEGIDNKSLEMLTSLRVGEALIVGEAVNYPVFIKVRKNYSQASKHEKTLAEAAKEFEENAEREKNEISSFL
ncbi:MAG: hypothetical protein DRO04_01315 [Candidatus Iainarchaeum archaeon]|uniref:Uncharacterized protein n=1 Tax=Candidatus Iainarchaeum sp. TaxID=3101447 RepID=A0A497JIL2_9ARCH|nr:MAG: hypothetical protein DRO04_01315 [Candidatus Diapherotrites archaeon]